MEKLGVAEETLFDGLKRYPGTALGTMLQFTGKWFIIR